MCATIGGNTWAAASGSEIVPPLLTEAITSPIEASTTALPAVLPVMSSACMIGTPAEVSDESVRDHRAIATFCTMSPIFIGTRSLNASQRGRPHLERLTYTNPTTVTISTASTRYHWWLIRCERATMNLVSVGSWPPNCLKTFSNTGIRNATSASSTTTANVITSDG